MPVKQPEKRICDHDIEKIVYKLKRSQFVIEQKKRSRAIVRAFEGATETGFLPAHFPVGTITFEVVPPSREAEFECTFTYWTGVGSRLEPARAVLTHNRAVGAFRIRQPNSMLDGSLADALTQLRFDRQIEYRLTYKSAGRPPTSAAKLREPFTLIVR